MMQDIPEEIVTEILQLGGSKDFREYRFVCCQWNRIVTPLLFRQMKVYEDKLVRPEEILVCRDLSAFIRELSIRQEVSGNMENLVRLIASHPVLQGLAALPKVGNICQDRKGQFACTLTSLDYGSAQPFLPALQEIQLFTTEEPFQLIGSFNNLEKLNVDLEAVRLPGSHIWSSLKNLYLRGMIDIDRLGVVLDEHRAITRCHLDILSFLRPIESSPSQICVLLRERWRDDILNTRVAESIFEYGEAHAEGHERSLLRHLYRPTDLANWELNRLLQMYIEDMGNTRVQLNDPSQFEATYCIRYFCEDERIIKDEADFAESREGQGT
ncbi:hypothetical protein AU210_016328 [Fusarium oxysporum f. sp. radicis-cucumerinum]|uniref:F-box domain-containing protein n=1 Tax=Fusarium oxysporum f. sp. radicis-cucumerinum TaxID=327505 RepID=A0A2H3G6P7_FUSOX|nr:hypothetical protein AU210_016328 [Fusarium oxysporum f. sp. radicis-cucumerinum]